MQLTNYPEKDIHVFHGDAHEVMREHLQGMQIDALITDPPYSSGAATLSDRQKSTAVKYTNNADKCQIPDFAGDTLDQRSWTHWMASLLQAGRELAKPGAVCCVFIDWRQLPSLTDALQWAGWCWRGTVVWDKTNSRPQRGRFRQQTEYVVWGSNGALPADRPVPVLPGLYSVKPPTQGNRLHQTQKPLDLMRQLVRICEPGGLILDPCCGSGTTLCAAKLEGYRAIGIEYSRHYAGVARKRVAALDKPAVEIDK